MGGDENGKQTPPYVSWKTFRNFIAELREGVTPPVIDRSVMKSKSGSVQSQLRTSLRFLGLIRDDDSVTEKFESLIDAYGTDEWEGELRDLILDSYASIIGDLNLKKGTNDQLHEKFRDYGASGSVFVKSVRFFLAALDAAGVDRSTYFETPKATTSKQSQKKPKSKKKDGEKNTGEEDKKKDKPGEEDAGGEIPEGMEVIPFAVPGRKDQAQIRVPEGLSEREWDMIDSYIRSYIAIREGT